MGEAEAEAEERARLAEEESVADEEAGGFFGEGEEAG